MSADEASNILASDMEVSDILQKIILAGGNQKAYLDKASKELGPRFDLNDAKDALISAGIAFLKRELRKLLRKPSKSGFIRFFQRAFGYLPEETEQ